MHAAYVRDAARKCKTAVDVVHWPSCALSDEMTALIDDPALGFTGPTRASIPRWPSSSTQDALQAQLKVPVKLSPRCPSSLAQGARQAQFKVYESSAIEFEPFGRPNTAAIRAASEGLSCIEAPAIKASHDGGRSASYKLNHDGKHPTNKSRGSASTAFE
jgi:hypothetical protein